MYLVSTNPSLYSCESLNKGVRKGRKQRVCKVVLLSCHVSESNAVFGGVRWIRQ